MAYPTDLTTDTASAGTNFLSTPPHSDRHNVIGSAVIAIELKMGLGAGSPVADRALIGSGNGTSAWTSTWDNATLGTPAIGTPSIIGGSYAAGAIGTPMVRGGTVGTALIGTSTIQGGTANNLILGTPTVIGSVAVSGTVTPLSFGAGIAPTVVTVADAPSGTITVNAQAGQIFHTILGTHAVNRTIGTPVNAATDGQSLVYRIKQNAAGVGTILWSSTVFRFNENGTPTLGTASTYNYFAWRYNGIDSKWDYQGNSLSVI